MQGLLRLSDEHKEEIVYAEGGGMLAQVAQTGGRFSISGNVPDQVGRGSEQPDLVKDCLLQEVGWTR